MQSVRHGDSLSPAMEVLNKLFDKASSNGVLKLLEPAVRFQCSMYVDDVILFVNPDIQEEPHPQDQPLQVLDHPIFWR